MFPRIGASSALAAQRDPHHNFQAHFSQERVHDIAQRNLSLIEMERVSRSAEMGLTH